MFLGMFGDDPDPAVTTVRIGFGTVLDMGKGSMHCAKRIRWLGGVWKGVGLRRERRNAARRLFQRPKTSDDLTDYNVAIVICWGIKRTPNAMKLGRRPTYNITTLHANFQPIPRTFSSHL